MTGLITKARASFHESLLESVLRRDKNGIPGNADKHSRQSLALAGGILDRIGERSRGSRLVGQRSGARFEEICENYVRETFNALEHLRPGTWKIGRKVAAGRLGIARFDQYAHLAALDKLASENPELASALGSDYIIKPDVVIAREPEEDGEINKTAHIVDSETSRLSSLRRSNNDKLILHASISCKWTLRSDRAQNARSEGLNLVQNRKGKLPHVVVITGEPTPNRIASIALGTGHIDCVYHFALPELAETAQELDFVDAVELLHTMIDGKRLRDISDLPLDLII